MVMSPLSEVSPYILPENATKTRELTNSKVLRKKAHLYCFIYFLLDLADTMCGGTKYSDNADSTLL
jgi:hypothetical protein